jgi:hypothetical protein
LTLDASDVARVAPVAKARAARRGRRRRRGWRRRIDRKNESNLCEVDSGREIHEIVTEPSIVVRGAVELVPTCTQSRRM